MRKTVIATLVLLGAYLALIAWLPPGGFIGSDQGVKLLQIDALAVPFYVLLGMRGLSVVSALGAVLAGFASGQLSALVGVRRPWVVVLVVGLATPMVYYATVLWEHAMMAGLPTALAVWLRPRPGAGIRRGLDLLATNGGRSDEPANRLDWFGQPGGLTDSRIVASDVLVGLDVGVPRRKRGQAAHREDAGLAGSASVGQGNAPVLGPGPQRRVVL